MSNMNTLKGLKQLKSGSKVEYDFNSLIGGIFKISSSKNFIKSLVSNVMNDRRNCPLVPKIYKDTLTPLVIDLDLIVKGDADNKKNVLKKAFNDKVSARKLIIKIRKIINEIFLNDLDIVRSPVIEKNVSCENIHIIYNKLWGTSQQLVSIIQYVITELEGDLSYNKDCDIVDLLKAKTIRLSLFNKSASGKEDYYKPYNMEMEEYIELKTEEEIKEYLLNNITSYKINKNFENHKELSDMEVDINFDEWLNKKEVKKVEKRRRPNVELIEYKFNHIDNGTLKEMALKMLKGFETDYFKNNDLWVKLIYILCSVGFEAEEIFEITNNSFSDDEWRNDEGFKEIEGMVNNYGNNDGVSVGIGSLVWLLKSENMDFYENEIHREFNKLNEYEAEETEKADLKGFENKFIKMNGDDNNINVFNGEFFEFMRLRSLYSLIDEHIETNEEDNIKVNLSNYEILKSYVSQHFISLRMRNEILVKGLDFEDGRVLWNAKKRAEINNSDLYYNDILYIGEEDEVNGFYDRKFNKKLKYKGLIIIYECKSLWNSVIKDIRFNKYNNYEYKPIGINEKFNYKKSSFYNTFGGFGYKDFEGLDVSEENIRVFKLFLEYMFKCVCSSRMDIMNFFFKWISDIIKNPRRKNGICFVFYSKEKSVGKGRIGDFLTKFLGDNNCLQSEIAKLMGRFNNNGDKTILNIYDEMNRDAFSKQNYNKLKNLICEIKQEKEKKGIDIAKSYDFNKYILMTNELDFLKVDTDETRFNLLHFLKLYGDDFNKYEGIVDKVINENVYMKMFGKIIEDIDISKLKNRRDWNNEKPKTKLDSLIKSMNIVEEFLKDILIGINSETYDMSFSKDGEFLIMGKNSLYANFLRYFNDKNNTDKSFGEQTFIRTFNSICISYMVEFKQRRKEMIKLNVKAFIKDFINRMIIEDKDFDKELFETLINGEEYTEQEQKEFKKTLRKIKKDGKTEIVEVEETKDDKDFKNWIINLYGGEEELKDLIVKPVVIVKKIIKRKRIIKKIKHVETHIIIDEEGQEIILFGNCLIDFD